MQQEEIGVQIENQDPHCKIHQDNVIKYIIIYQSGVQQEIQRCCSKCLNEIKKKQNFNANDQDAFKKEIAARELGSNKILVKLQTKISECLQNQKQRMMETRENIKKNKYTSNSQIDEAMSQIIKKDFDAYQEMINALQELFFDDAYEQVRQNQQDFYKEIFLNSDAYELLGEYQRKFFQFNKFNKYYRRILSQADLNENQNQVEKITDWTSNFVKKSDEYINRIKVNLNNYIQCLEKQKKIVKSVNDSYKNFLNTNEIQNIGTQGELLFTNQQKSNQIKKHIQYYNRENQNQNQQEYYCDQIYRLFQNDERQTIRDCDLLPDKDQIEVETQLQDMFPTIQGVQRKNLKCYTAQLKYQQSVLNPHIKTRSQGQIDILVNKRENGTFDYSILRGNERIDFENLDQVKSYSYNFDKKYQITYEGALNEYLERSGQGILKVDKEKIYEGGWQDGLFHGQGKQYMPQYGKTIEGQFENGKKKGTFQIENGGVIEFSGDQPVCALI